jgi:hypothetical protein
VKYVFVQLFPALNAAETAVHCGAASSDAFGRPLLVMPAEDAHERCDGDGCETAATPHRPASS